MKMKKILSCILVVIVFTCVTIGCDTNTNNNENLLSGNWQAVGWTDANNKTLEQTSNVKFTFGGGKYNYQNNEINEKGTYKVENDMLFTTAEGENEMMVKIIKITKDSLILGMNRAGQIEFLSLVKK